MNKLIIKSAILTLAIAIMFPISAMSQEKKVHVKTVKEINGEKLVTDTLFVVTDDKDKVESINTFTWVAEGDSNEVITINMDVEVDSDNDTDVEKKIIIMKSGDHGSGYDVDCKEHKIKIVTNGEGDENVFFFNGEDFEVDEEKMKQLKIELENVSEEMKNIHIELDDEKTVSNNNCINVP